MAKDEVGSLALRTLAVSVRVAALVLLDVGLAFALYEKRCYIQSMLDGRGVGVPAWEPGRPRVSLCVRLSSNNKLLLPGY